MDSSSASWNLEVKTKFSPPSQIPISELREQDTAAVNTISAAPPTDCNETFPISCAVPPGPEGRTHHSLHEPQMLSSVGLKSSQASSGPYGDEHGRSAYASWASTKERGVNEYVKDLQEAGRYALWAPLLHGASTLEEPSLLLGQIRFDVTADDQRGSWLLPEELLAQQRRPVDEDGDDRQLFTNTPITEEEQQAIDHVLMQLLEVQRQKDVGNNAQKLPEALLGVQPAWLEQLVLRYLYSCSFDKQKTFDLLQSTLTFRTQQLPVLESEVYHELRNMGACYWHGRDRKMRPLLVVSLQRLQQLQREAAVEEKVTRLVVFCLEFFLRYLCVAGVVENWCILCDLKGTSILSFPLPLLLKLVQLIQGSYRGRLYRFYILYAPRLFHFIAKPLVSSLPATTAKKLRVFTSPDDWHHERRAQFAGHQLEKKYGGTAPDIIENWYPFRFFPGPFEPECEAGHSGASQTAVRWESDQALHERVHPLVHTGVSLHTSLMWKRGAEKQGGGPFRYAAWLRYLPELRLAPATVEWAKGMLSTRLQGCHDFLVQHLRGSESAAAGASADLPVDNDIAGETPNSLSSDKAQQELLMNKEADSQRVGDPSIVPPPAADAPKIPDTWAVQRGPPRESSVDTVSSTSPLHKCAPTPLPGTHTTSSCLDASFTAKGLVEITTWSSVSTLVGSGGLKGVSTAAELSALCSSGPYTPAERFQLPLPHAALARLSAKADSEGQCEYRSSTIGAPEEFHARQLHSIPPSNMASGVSRSGACSTSTPEAQRQVVCYEYVTSLASRLDLLGGSGRSATSKKTRGAPLTEMQPKQCSALSTAACNDMRDAQEIERTNGSLSRTVSTNLHKNKQESHGWSLESDSRIDIERSAPLSSAARRNRRCLRRLEGPIQQQKSSCELLSMSFRSHSNTFLGGVGIGEGVGIRRCPALRRRLTDSSGCIRGSPIASRSAARTSANMKAVSGSSGCRTLCISSAVEEQRLFKGAQRKATLPAVQTGHVFGRSQRMRLKEPKQTAPVLSPEPRFNVLHTQPLEVSSFLAERPIAVSPSSKAQDHPCASQGNAIAIHSPQSEVLRADSAHSKHNVLPLGKASADRSFMMAYDMKAECCEFPQSAKAQNLGKEGGSPRLHEVGLSALNGRSMNKQIRGRGMQLNAGIVQSGGGVCCSGSGKPRRALGRILPLFLLAATAVSLVLCAGASVPAGLGLDLLLHPCWITRKSIRLSNRVGLKGETTASTIGRSLAIHGYGKALNSTFQKLGWKKGSAVASSAFHWGLFSEGEHDFRPPRQQGARRQPLYNRVSGTAKTTFFSGEVLPAKPFYSVARGLLFSASRLKRPIEGEETGHPLSAVPCSLSMRRAVRVPAVKQKSRGSIDKRFKVTATGKLLYRRPGRQHHARTKSSARRTRLRRVAALKPSQISRLLGPLRVNR